MRVLVGIIRDKSRYVGEREFSERKESNGRQCNIKIGSRRFEIEIYES